MSETKETKILTSELPTRVEASTSGNASTPAAKPAAKKKSVKKKTARKTQSIEKPAVKPVKGVNSPNIRFIGEKGREQSSMQGSDRSPIWTISPTVNQGKPFFHPDAALIIRSLPHLYAYIGADTKNQN